MKKFIKLLPVLTGLLLLSLVSFAQPGNGNGGPPPNPRNPTIPLDGGISWLAAAGLAYGARKLYLNNKQAKASEEERS